MPSDLGRLSTDRLILRRWAEADRGPFAALNADPEVMRHFPTPLDRVGSDALLDRLERGFDERGVGLWALELPGPGPDAGRLIGFAGLNPMPSGVPGAGEWEVGWRLERRSWGQGYAVEAARAALEVAFWVLGSPRVWSLTAVVNERSQAVMRRLGMSWHATVSHPAVPEGHPLRPHVIYLLARPAKQANDNRSHLS